MKYCNKCKVNVHHQLDNCPLCGSFLDKANDNDNCTAYKDMDNIVTYPKLKEVSYVPFFKYKFNKILLVLAAIAIVLNILLTPQSHWSYYVAIGVVLVIFGVMSPINNKMKLVAIIRRNIWLVTAAAIAVEFGLLDWKFVWFTPEYVLPIVFNACIVLLDFLIIFQRKTNKQLFSTLIYVTIFALCPQIVFWITPLWGIKPTTLIPFVSFFAALLNLLVVFIVCSRSLKEEMERNLNF